MEDIITDIVEPSIQVIEPVSKLKKSEIKTFTQEEVDAMITTRLSRFKIETENGILTKAQIEAEVIKSKLPDFVAIAKQEWIKEQAMTETEKEIKRTAEQKESLKDERVSLYKELAEAKLKDSGFSIDEIEMHLSNIVSDDKIATMGKAQRICDFRKEALEKSAQEFASKFAGSPAEAGTGGNVSTLQSEFDAFKIKGNSIGMTSCIINASKQGIVIKQ